jgi:hypothetical protein
MGMEVTTDKASKLTVIFLVRDSLEDPAHESHNGVDLQELICRVFTEYGGALPLDKFDVIFIEVNILQRVAVPRKNVAIEPNPIHSASEAPRFFLREDTCC